MRYGGRLNRIEFTALIDQQAGRVRANAATLPLYGPATWPGPCRLGAWGWEDDRLMHAGLLYGSPEGAPLTATAAPALAGAGLDAPGTTVTATAPAPDSPWVEVITTAGPPMPQLIDLRMAATVAARTDRRSVERALRAASTPAPERVTIPVDGVPREFSRWPDEPLGDSLGRGWLAILDEVPGLLLRVSGLAPADLALARVRDVEPHLTGTRAHLLAGYDAYGSD
ncbi:hypothetical protein ACQP1P_38225 [Dactylosporangium sp. CA-052675]|uniref:hypothetical protein n=1 Tax=Dactylosporangium sp. CA-052675 TaxID=3239927 RepID=UPI003D92BCC3